MKKKNKSPDSSRKEELRKELKKKSSALERLKRELKIEVALEKVREIAMAMHKSDELHKVAKVLLDELNDLGIGSDGKITTAVVTFDEDKKGLNFWIASPGFPTTVSTLVPYNKHPIVSDLWKARDSGVPYFSKVYGHKETNSWWKWALVHTSNKNLPDDRKKLLLETKTYAHAIAFAKHSGIYIRFDLKKLPKKKESETLNQFAKVFDQSNIRFLDLQKAEAQVRESQIEAALERVRSRSMSMQKSEELGEVSHVINKQLQQLSFKNYIAGFLLDYRDSNDFNICRSDTGGTVLEKTSIPYFDHPVFNDFKRAKEAGLDFYTTSLTFEEKNRWVDHALMRFKEAPPEVKEYLYNCAGYTFSCALLKHVGLFIENFDGIPFSKEENAILLRFGKVFEQTYTRFLDLQKAEAQAREAQVEAALERVRSRTMAMQKSNELTDVAGLLFAQVNALGIKMWTTGFNVWSEDNNSYTDYITSPAGGFVEPYTIYSGMTELLKEVSDARKSGIDFFVQYAEGERLKQTYLALSKFGDQKQYEIMLKGGFQFPSYQYDHFVFGSKISLMFITYEPVPESHDIFKRFGKVFEQTYTRFLDIQKAEGQAREAHIEAAMEKVRSRALAMQKPDELVEVAQLLRKEMNLLGVEELETSSIYIHHEETQKTECWYAIKDVEQPEKELVSDHMIIDLHETSVGREMLEFYHSGEKKISIVMQGGARKEWINYCADHSKVLVGFYGDTIPDRTYHLYKFPGGYVGAASPGDISAESWDLLQRTTSVFSLAYTRFSDLQQAEAQAREAQVEAALERVRSRTLAMQKSDELAETAAVVFQQLIKLGIEPNRLYIGIIKDESGNIEFWITDEDGTKVSNQFTANISRNYSVQKMHDGWAAQYKSLIIDMQGEELSTYFRYLSNELQVPFKGGLAQKRRVQTVAYFAKGFIAMASPEPQPEETIQLLERFAAVFNLTYTRFNDLKIAEAHAQQAELDLIKLQTEKKRAEDALTELRETQKQLIQSEKMASLGELTAGIAHEIQNPLNFINNFSDVNKELLAELKEEIEKGNYEEVKLIAEDIAGNEEKISHHGKRADSIVKGMLQHSRTTSTTKELTDINALADEYLRLAYHGLRAKDKSFNATMRTGFDEAIGKINIIPQDIGRVILNVVTNAFYTVNEKKKVKGDSYEPTVSLFVKKADDIVKISVKDNGNGISQKIVDKIFQPFFTTKPTGQGTGLGLSLAYDIVKAHGGDLKVETEEGEGTAFTIQLPV